MSDTFQVQVQGVDPALSRSTGSYDPIDLGSVDAGRLAEILTKVSRMEMPDGFEEGKDVCIPSVVVKGPKGLFQMNLAEDGGTLYCDQLQGNFGIPQIMMVVTGQPWSDPRPSRPDLCPGCGEKLDPSDQFCAGCGAKMSPAAASNPPSKKERQARRKEKQAQSDSRFQEMTGKSLEQMNDEVIGLMANPLPLGQYRERFPLLLNGAKNPAWDLLLDFMFRKDPPPPVRARLGSSPRDWAIRKPGWFRRLLTLIVDFPALLVLFSIVIKQGPKVCQALGFASNGWGEGIFMLSGFLGGFIGYYVLFELLLGASPGGFLLGLRVVDEYGKPPGIGFLVMRQVWKILDLFFMFLGGAARLNLPPTSHTTLVIPEFLPGEVVIR